jgi:cyanophycin synthetase
MALLDRTGGPFVVKPARDTGGGQGVTTSLTDARQLPQAAALAAAFCNELLIEQQLSGANYRLLYLDGKLLDAIQRRPPTLTGDGKHTIRQLVAETNRRRTAAGHKVSQVLLSADLDMKRTLALLNLALSSVLPDGKSIVVKTVINENAALDNVSAMEQVCDAVVRAGATAAQVVGARLAGVDVITTDPTRPLDECGGVILEVNTTPGFYCHQLRQGGCPVAEQVLRTIFDLPTINSSQPDGSVATAAT